MQDYRRWEAWRHAYEGTLAVYRLTNQFPREETYGLVAQMRRAAVSVISNIAEGAGRRSHLELATFLDIARASCVELECQLMLASDLAFGEANAVAEARRTFGRVRKMLTSVTEAVRKQHKV